MSNVISFDSFENLQEIAAYQIGLPRIVLEGKDDVRLFKLYWFPHLIDSFEFVEASDVVDGGGCTAVRDAVRKSKQDNIPAFGIADRDTLFRAKEWTPLFTIDDSVFVAVGSSADFYTTLRWEVEAYLLEPDLLPAWLRSHSKKLESTEAAVKAVELAVEECEQLLRAHRFFATAHHVGVSVSDAYCWDQPIDSYLSKCNAGLAKLHHDGTLVAAIDGFVERIIEAAPTDTADRLVWFLRYVDTKRLLRRLSERFKGEKDVRWFLAELMLHGGRRPSEIELKLLEVRDVLAA